MSEIFGRSIPLRRPFVRGRLWTKGRVNLTVWVAILGTCAVTWALGLKLIV